MFLDPKRVEQVFADILELADPDARAQLLNRKCGDDQALRRRVEELLTAYSDSGSFLEPPDSLAPRILRGANADPSARPDALIDTGSREPTTNNHSPGSDSEDVARRSLPRRFPEDPPRVLPQIPGYLTVDLLGEGGMGSVYRAVDQRLQRMVALKVLTGTSASRLARFQIEAQAAARLQHSNIVQIFDIGSHLGMAYLVLELVEGGSLAERLRGKPLPPREADRLLRRVGVAVQHAHEHGIVHRDLKTANVLLTPGGATRADLPGVPATSTNIHAVPLSECDPKIADFGMARLLGMESGHTKDGEIVGTPGYMAPEQAAGRVGEIGPATDVYALGAMLYEMLTGRPPFHGHTLVDTLEQVLANDPVPPRQLQPKVPRDLETICLKCLQKEPPKRYSSAQELVEELDRFLGGRAIRARPVSRPERLWRWTRRHKGLAAGLAAAVLSLVALSITSGLAAQHFRRLAGVNATLAEEKDKERASAEQARELAQKRGEEMRSSLYQAQMNLAGEAADAPSGISRVEELLDPWQAGAPDLRGWEWYYLRGLGQGALLDLPGHGEWALAVWSPDGTRLATSGADGVLRIRDAVTAREVQCLQTSAGVRALTWSPDGSRLATGGKDRVVRVWNAADGTFLAAYRGHSQDVQALAWSPEGTRLASGSDDSSIKVWQAPAAGAKGNGKSPDVLGGPLPRFSTPTLSRHKASVYCLAWSPDGARLASGSQDGDIRVWDMAQPGEGFVLNKDMNRGAVHALTWNPAGSLLASGGVDQTVHIWDMTSRERKHKLPDHVGYVCSLAWSRDGARLASGSRDHTVKVWDPAQGQASWTLRGHPGVVYSVAWAPDCTRLVSAAGAVPAPAREEPRPPRPARCESGNSLPTRRNAF